jgi:hypothetical protein
VKGRRITVRLEDDALLEQRDHLTHGGLLLRFDDPPPPMSDVELTLEAPVGKAELTARVVHHMPDGGVGLSFDDVEAARASLAPLFDRAEGKGGRAPANIQQRIHRMTTDEKRELALTGDRIARLALMRDTNKLIHTYVLRNPNLSSEEVRVMAGMRNSNPDVLQKIAASPEWTRDQRIVSAVVSNPKTPSQVATRLLDKVSPGELRRLSKASETPPAVQREARRKLAR